jgi:hypothetical protein
LNNALQHFSRPPHIKDLEALEPAFYNSLLWIQENDPEPLDLTFTVEEVGALTSIIAFVNTKAKAVQRTHLLCLPYYCCWL